MALLAPIIIFAFNRPDVLKSTIDSLLRNEEAESSLLYIFVDGARPQQKGETEKVEKVHTLIKSITGFKEIHYKFALHNQGLGSSIIQGVSTIINQYGHAIILEDDLILAPNFLAFMNKGLELYEKDKKVFSICGYSNKVKAPKGYENDAYFCTRSSSWGWATWADRWNSVDWELKDWDNYTALEKKFNKWGGSDCWKMLHAWKSGKNQSWAIRFCFAQFLQDKLSLFPIISKVKNDGFDGKGTNCKKWSRFKYEFDMTSEKHFKLPQTVSINRQLFRSAMSYHGVIIRIYSKLMYILNQ